MRVKHHEISSVLSAASMAVIMMGLVLGFQFSTLKNELISRFSSAADQCMYHATAEVHKDTKGNLASLSEIGTLQVVNNRGHSSDLTEGGVARTHFATDNLALDPRGRTNYKPNDKASVILKKLDTSIWKIKGVFCDAKPGSAVGCPTEYELRGKDATIRTFRVNCGVDITYGWIIEKKVGLPNPTSTPFSVPPTPTIRPGGPTVRPTTRPANPTQPIGGAPNPTTPAGGGNPPAGKGALEVQVVALNYPQKTSLWPENDPANAKPNSCAREGARPLYLNPFDIRVSCVGGGCRVGGEVTVKVDKRKGYANFNSLTPGNYKLIIKGLSDGYNSWSGCANQEWVVKAGETNKSAVVILENKTSGTYELRTTEKLCKDAKGLPHLVERIEGNVCYFKPGSKTEPKPPVEGKPQPQPTAVPTPVCKNVDAACSDVYKEKCSVGGQQGMRFCYKFGQCTAPGDGTKCTWRQDKGSYCEGCVPNNLPLPPTTPNGDAHLRVRVENGSARIKDAVVRLNPCPQRGVCDVKVTFSGLSKRDAEFTVFPSNIQYRVNVVSLSYQGADATTQADQSVSAVDNLVVKAQQCGTGYVERLEPDYDTCVTRPPGLNQFSIMLKTDNIPPKPPVAPQPPQKSACGTKEGACKVACETVPFEKNCSPDSLRPYFGEFGEKVVRQASAICWLESKGGFAALNDRCFQTGPRCIRGQKNPSNCSMYDFSAGMFQINQMDVCVKGLGQEKTLGPLCQLIPGIDPYKCVADKGLLTIDGNALAAKDYYMRSGWKPWKTHAVNCGYPVARQ